MSTFDDILFDVESKQHVKEMNYNLSNLIRKRRREERKLKRIIVITALLCVIFLISLFMFIMFEDVILDRFSNNKGIEVEAVASQIIQDEFEPEDDILYGHKAETYSDWSLFISDNLPNMKSHEFLMTNYCGCSKCCGKWSSGYEYIATGALGTKLIPFESIAVDPDVIPLGTTL